MTPIDASRTQVESPVGGGGRAHPGQIRRVPDWQLHHVLWHRLRVWEGRGDASLLSPEKPDTGRDRVIVGFFVGKDMRGMVELRTLSAYWPCRAQVSISIEAAWHGQGIGTALMAEAVDVARERGIDRLCLSCHALNRHTQSIAERFGATFGFEGCEFRAEIALESRSHVTAA